MEDTISKYFYRSDGEVNIDEFLKKNRPTLITSDDVPWIWVQGKNDKVEQDPERDTSRPEALAAAMKIMDNLVGRLLEIERDDTIPVRGKKGVKSKKAVRDEAYEEVTAALKKLSIESKWTCGKWLLFPGHSAVDGIWGELARSVAEGPLGDAGVVLAKVAPSKPSLGEGEEQGTHLICLYMNNIYDKIVVRKVLETLLTCHGLEPSAAKSDLYTLAGIDSSHPSKLRSSIWRPGEIIEGGPEAIKALKAQHTKKKAASGDAKAKVDHEGFINSDSEDDKMVSSLAKRKTAPAQDEKASGLEAWAKSGSDSPEKKVAKPPVKRARNAAVKYQEDDVFAAASDSD